MVAGLVDLVRRVAHQPVERDDLVVLLVDEGGELRREAGHVLGPRLDGARGVGKALELGLELGLLPLQLVRRHARARRAGRGVAAGFAATGFGLGFGGSTTTMRRPRIACNSASSFDVRSAASASTAAEIASGADAAASRRLLKTSRSRNNAASAAVARPRDLDAAPGVRFARPRFSIIRRRFLQSCLAFPEQRPDARVDGVPGGIRHGCVVVGHGVGARAAFQRALAGVDALDQGRGALERRRRFLRFSRRRARASEGRAALTMARTTSMLLVSISHSSYASTQRNCGAVLRCRAVVGEVTRLRARSMRCASPIELASVRPLEIGEADLATALQLALQHISVLAEPHSSSHCCAA